MEASELQPTYKTKEVISIVESEDLTLDEFLAMLYILEEECDRYSKFDIFFIIKICYSVRHKNQ